MSKNCSRSSYGTLETEQAPKMTKEKSQTGAISRKVYSGYLIAGLNCLSGTVLFLTISIFLGGLLYSDIWLSKWTNSNDLQLETCNSQFITNPSIVNNLDEKTEECLNINESNEFYFRMMK